MATERLFIEHLPIDDHRGSCRAHAGLLGGQLRLERIRKALNRLRAVDADASLGRVHHRPWHVSHRQRDRRKVAVRRVHRWSAPRRDCFTAAEFLIGALAVSHHSLWLLYGGYGVLGGLGMGMGYICPVPPITKWFPDKRGLMTGAAVMGFGGGALIVSPIAARLIQAHGVPATLLSFGSRT